MTENDATIRRHPLDVWFDRDSVAAGDDASAHCTRFEVSAYTNLARFLRHEVMGELAHVHGDVAWHLSYGDYAVQEYAEGMALSTFGRETYGALASLYVALNGNFLALNTSGELHLGGLRVSSAGPLMIYARYSPSTPFPNIETLPSHYG